MQLDKASSSAESLRPRLHAYSRTYYSVSPDRRGIVDADCIFPASTVKYSVS